jgi:hypothetical protein
MAALKLNLRWRGLAPTEATPRLRENYVIAPVAAKKIRSRARSLLIADHLRRRFGRFKLSERASDALQKLDGKDASVGLNDAQRHHRVNFPRSIAGKMASPI